VRVVVLLALLAVGCGRNEAKGNPGGGSGDQIATAKLEREQAKFDAERRPDQVVEALGIKPGSRVADIGAGSGLLTIHLARAVKPGGRVIATDIDEEVFKIMDARLAWAGLQDLVEPRVVGAETSGLERGAYDAILLAEVDHYFADPVEWLRGAALALKPDGRLVVSNRIHHRPKSMAAAEKAGLRLASESAPVPTHFIAVFVAKEST
jgi:2-polyprenyl-3-methyl-5-hydroxy-6-metoxy-1,4-benzoquinol methylase